VFYRSPRLHVTSYFKGFVHKGSNKGSVYFCNDDKELQDLIYDKDNRLTRSFVDFFVGGKKKPLALKTTA
jgi:hypothetical protein